jgi:hypothetical protein
MDRSEKEEKPVKKIKRITIEWLIIYSQSGMATFYTKNTSS